MIQLCWACDPNTNSNWEQVSVYRRCGERKKKYNNKLFLQTITMRTSAASAVRLSRRSRIKRIT